ncbi:MAG: radical SAM protein [Lentisphaeria bacterium]|nr:radical SAM protein [Lentisphaeria bacterium]
MNYRKDTFVRHAGEESLLWNRRTSACVILQDAKPFLDALTYEPQSEEEIIRKVAATFETAPAEVAADVREFLAMLVAESFCESDAGPAADAAVSEGGPASFDADGEKKDDSWTPLGSFFEKHHLPTELHIDLTNGCTERCIHCYIPDYTPHFLPLETVKKVLHEFRDAGGLTIHFSGGECMMHPDFAEILRYAKSLRLNMLILSNLTLCDEKIVRLLQEIDPQFVNVSLYSMDPAIHDGITRFPGSWGRTMSAILTLERAGVHIRLACPVMKPNRDSLPGLLDFAREHHMHLIPDLDIFGQTDHDCSNQACALSPAEFEAVLTRHRELFHQIPSAPSAYAPEAKVCDIGKARIDINAEGNYYPCDGCHGIVLGNAATHTFSEVWYGEKLNALRALKNRDFGTCAACGNRPWCKVCPTRNFNETGDMLKHAPKRCIAAAIQHKIYGV